MRLGAGVFGIAAVALLVAPAFAAPEVVTLGQGDPSADPVAACGELVASPYEAGWEGRGHTDKQIYIDGALTACEAAVTAAPDSPEASAWRVGAVSSCATTRTLPARFDPSSAARRPALPAPRL